MNAIMIISLLKKNLSAMQFLQPYITCSKTIQQPNQDP